MNPQADFVWTGLPAVSRHAAHIDHLGIAFTVVILVFTVPVFVVMAYFAIKYRRGSKADRSDRPSSNTWLEVSWTVGPFVVLLGFFVWAAWLYMDLGRPPSDAMEISVVGKQWMWKFQHPGGQREINMLHVPVGQPIKLNMISEDVIHSLFLPVLRIKHDVLPGRYTNLWFEATETGVFRLECTQFCGTDHSLMGGFLVIMAPGAYAAWLHDQPQETPLVMQGEAAFHRFGCSGCHDAASSVRAPRLNGLFGRTIPLSGSRIVTVDERYIRDSILTPPQDVAAGYGAVMPSFAGVLDEATISALVAYIKALPSAEHAP